MDAEEAKNFYAKVDHRVGDNEIRIVREIPLWGVVSLVITGIIVGASTFINQYYGQKELFILVQAQTVKISEMTDQLTKITVSLQGKDLKDLEHDLRLGDIGRRITTIEAKENFPVASPRRAAKSESN